MRVRAAREADLAPVLALLRADVVRATPEPGTVTRRHREALAEITADPHADVLVGEVEGRIVATCQVNWLRHLTHDAGLVCQVEAVRVAAAARGRGHGRRLMAHVLDEARGRGAVRVQLTSNVDRADAHRFYRSLGFEASHLGMKRYLEGPR